MRWLLTALVAVFSFPALACTTPDDLAAEIMNQVPEVHYIDLNESEVMVLRGYLEQSPLRGKNYDSVRVFVRKKTDTRVVVGLFKDGCQSVVPHFIPKALVSLVRGQES